jgi:hypothetical protein
MDVLGVVLAGTITLAADEPKGGGAELTAWHAFVAPGGGITLRAKTGPARLVLIVVTSGEALAAKVAAAKANPWTARPAPIASLDLAAATDLAWGKGAYHARIGFGAEASPRASLGILKMSASGVVAPHVHEKEWEHMAILEGEGDFIKGPANTRPRFGRRHFLRAPGHAAPVAAGGVTRLPRHSGVHAAGAGTALQEARRNTLTTNSFFAPFRGPQGARRGYAV